ncbi:MAG TPA: thioredoxin [Bacteroidales bacterium]|nr:thioredoxin [Bacteroidales bacterium]HPT51706.1 thioredoxin [Bacteroidales bacterium]
MKNSLSFTIITIILCLFFAQSKAQSPSGENKDAGIEQNKNETKFKVITITQEEFKKKVFDYTDTAAEYKGKKPAIVDFYAEWCGPCKKLTPIMEELAKEYGNKIVIYKINTDENKELSRTLSITSIPTIYFFPVKSDPRKAIGFLTKEKLIEIINTILLPKNSK